MRREESGIRRAQLESEWRDRLARQASSGQSIAAFCRSEGIKKGTFYGWRSRLGMVNANDGQADTAIKMPLPFIDIGTVKPAAKNDSSPTAKHNHRGDQNASIEMRLELGNGIV